MTVQEITDLLTADVKAYTDAATQAERQTALVQWMNDVSRAIVESYTNIASATMLLRRIQRRLIDRGVIWNPVLRDQLGEE